MGGYAEEEPEEDNSAQFDLSDGRTLDEIVSWLLDLGYIPSFCTACLPGRTHRRSLHVSCKEGTDCQLLSSKCIK